MENTDNVSVMRRGMMVGHVKTAQTSPEQLAELMVGRKVLLEVDKAPATPGDVVLKVENLRVVDEAGVERLKGVSFDIRKGEILGVAGVAGNGQSELLAALAGLQKATGAVTFEEQSLPLSGAGANGRARRAIGIGHIPEDRQVLGLIMDFMAWEDMAFGYHHDAKYQKNALVMDNAAIRADTEGKMTMYDVRPPLPNLPAKSFSGGNQQKIVVAREIENDPDLLLVGQPTRGVDIGAIEFIHKEIIALRDAGKAVLLVSVELDEIMSLSDRIAVMFDGRIMGFKDPAQTNERELGLLMAGVVDKGAAA
jgi:general nucleoside transport system ATP-binding protein